MRFRRPFSNAHRVLLVGLVVAWPFAMLGTSCGPPAHDFQVALATFTVCVALWASHLRAHGRSGWRQVASTLTGAAYDLLLLLAASLVVAVALVAFTGGQCYTPKAKASEVILSASGARVRISQRVEQSQTLAGAGTGISIPIEGRTKAAMVRDDGTIIVAGDDPPVVVILQPTLVDGELHWQCIGMPARLMPGSCR